MLLLVFNAKYLDYRVLMMPNFFLSFLLFYYYLPSCVV
ncbi:hypothetical protein FEM08_27800 [Flavobacterium gilvum]|nr:hypothetical protein FEM08_27800 [Flavobacterium gilvum]